MLLIALLLVGTPAPAAARTLPSTAVAARTQLAQQQRARFERRLAQLAEAVERQRAAGLSAGRVAFMQQDLARVADGVASTLRIQGYMTAAEERSYTAMLGQVARKLARADAERAPQLALVSRR